MLLVLGYFPSYASATTVNATSCSQIDVQNAIRTAITGDVVSVPAGNCAWTSLILQKAVTLQGAGIGNTNIDFGSGAKSFEVIKQSTGVTKIKGFSFSCNNANIHPHALVVDGSWLSAEPVVFQNNNFSMNGCAMFDITVAGGVIFSRNSFTGLWNDFALALKDTVDTNSWTTADSMGTNDANGKKNIYIEDNTFNGQSNGVLDCDDNIRVVLRYNTFIESGGYNSHGRDSSPDGCRHFEIYNNSFRYPDPNTCPSMSSLSNVNQYIWLRGATGVIFNNSMENLIGQCWGDKPEIKLSIRGAEDDRPQGTCAQVSYPVPHQLGQNNNGIRDFTDPIYFWGNTGSIAMGGGWGWGNPCGFNWNTFFQWGRDGINPSGAGGNPKPGYTSYTYPHPLISDATLTDSVPPAVTISLQ